MPLSEACGGNGESLDVRVGRFDPGGGNRVLRPAGIGTVVRDRVRPGLVLGDIGWAVDHDVVSYGVTGGLFECRIRVENCAARIRDHNGLGRLLDHRGQAGRDYVRDLDPLGHHQRQRARPVAAHQGFGGIRPARGQ